MFRTLKTILFGRDAGARNAASQRTLLSWHVFGDRTMPAAFTFAQGVLTVNMAEVRNHSLIFNDTNAQGIVRINGSATGGTYNFVHGVSGGHLRANLVKKIVVNGSNDLDVINLQVLDASDLPVLPGNGSITDTSAAIVIYGNGARDTINGSAFNDLIDAGDGDDRVFGQGGSDRIHGSFGADLIYGDGSSLVNDVRGGDDFINAGTGNDTIWGCGGVDSLLGGSGQDYMHGGHGNDSVDGGAENDTLYGDWGNDTVIGGAGADYMNGGSDAGNHDVDWGYADNDDRGLPRNLLNFEMLG